MVQKTKSLLDKNMNYIILLAVLSMLGINIPGLTPEKETTKGVKVEEVKELQRNCYDRIELTEETQRDKNRELHRRVDNVQDDTRDLKRDLIERVENLTDLQKETLNRVKRLENYNANLTTENNEETGN